MARKIFGVIGGLVVAFALVFVLEQVSSYAFAPPALDPSDPESAKEMMRRMPATGFLAILVIYFVSTLLGGLTAAKVAREPWASWVVGGFILAATLVNVFTLPHPIWFTILAVLLIAAAGWLGGVWGRTEPEEDDPSANAWGPDGRLGE